MDLSEEGKMIDQNIVNIYPPCDRKKIWNSLQHIPGIKLYSYNLDINDFQTYLKKAKYPKSYRNTFAELFIEKALEQYVSIKLFDPTISLS